MAETKPVLLSSGKLFLGSLYGALCITPVSYTHLDVYKRQNRGNFTIVNKKMGVKFGWYYKMAYLCTALKQNEMCIRDRDMLVSGGRLYFEINQEYGRETVDMLAGLEYKNIELRKDLFQNDRMKIGRAHV